MQNQINPYNLFSKDILDYKVDTKKFGWIKYVNLDNAATTPPLLCVEEGIKNFLRHYGSVHRGAGAKSKLSTDEYEQSREIVKKFVGADNDNYVLYAPNTTGAMSMLAYFMSFLPGKVAVSSIEHSSSYLPWIKAEGLKYINGNRATLDSMEKINDEIKIGGSRFVLRYQINNDFEFDLKNLESMLKESWVKALVVTASSNLTGYCPDLIKIGKLARKYKAYFVVDGCQFIQHHSINMKEMGIDFLTASSHKIYAPYGSGFLVGPKDFFDRFLPYQIGGGNLPYITAEGDIVVYNSQLTHDPGTPNAVGAIAMSLALNKLMEIGLENVEQYEKSLTAKTYEALKNNSNVELYVSAKHLNTIIPFNIKNRNFREVAETLNSHYGIGVRADNFCVYEAVRKLLPQRDEASIVASVRAGDPSKIPGIVRASFGLCNTQNDADRLIEAIEGMTK